MADQGSSDRFSCPTCDQSNEKSIGSLKYVTDKSQEVFTTYCVKHDEFHEVYSDKKEKTSVFWTSYVLHEFKDINNLSQEQLATIELQIKHLVDTNSERLVVCGDCGNEHLASEMAVRNSQQRWIMCPKCLGDFNEDNMLIEERKQEEQEEQQRQ